MSYADAAKKGPAQSADEKMPDTVPEIAHSDSGIHSLDSMSSISQSNSQPSYADQQLAHERAQEAEQNTREAADETAQQAKEFGQQADVELQRLEKESGKRFSQFSDDAKASYEQWKKSASKDFERAKKEMKKDSKKAQLEAKKGAEWADENKGNPVLISNAVVLTAVAGLLGVGAYRLHARNELTMKVVGAWAGVVGLFGVADYYVSQYFFRTHYPTKQ
ncbi:uncharacterized protein LTR77_000672 [Saxophila tyrrhenica]|uniref:Mitochondrial outer membrane protein OM14 C-terminal domain-containing protein n=1 Tax=Saxophila tyrrhenica TaxID=1690608 RepID=A0AAV9PQL3_9PEZI|nr:hypothetical protein LTR77_000672 [Saxophila tyrrhenica]